MRPAEASWFANAGLQTPEDFLALPGEIVGGHPDRHVLRVEINSGEEVRGFYLKREHRTRWHERWRSWRDGLGWSPKTVREGYILRRLADEGLLVPRWVAYGEDAIGRAFLLIEEVAGAFDLRRLPLEGLDPVVLAERLGQASAELHQAGIDHPDLYAKHFLVHPSTLAITLLDWERTRASQLDQRTRIRALATLHASVADERIGRKVRLRFLWAYCRVMRYYQSSPIGDRFSKIAQAIQVESGRLLRRRGIREQRQPRAASGAQRLIWIDREAVCAIPQVAEALRPAAMRAMLEDPRNDGNILTLPGYPAVRLEIRRYRWSIDRVWSQIRRKSWRSPGLKLARLLFHLERHHVPAPRLLAYGQRDDLAQAATSFTLIEACPKETISLERWWPGVPDWDHRLMLRNSENCWPGCTRPVAASETWTPSRSVPIWMAKDSLWRISRR